MAEQDKRESDLTPRFLNIVCWASHFFCKTPHDEKAIICRGEDPTGSWRNFDRPSGDDVSPKDGPKSVGGN